MRNEKGEIRITKNYLQTPISESIISALLTPVKEDLYLFLNSHLSTFTSIQVLPSWSGGSRTIDQKMQRVI
jgi:hypothetical protein